MNKTLHRIYIGIFFAVGIASLFLLIYHGVDYYSLQMEERPFDIKHDLLKPSGYIGHGLGITGTLMMIIGVSVYMIRKRMRVLFSFGYLKNWLEFHMFLCSVGPLLVLFHTAFKFGGIVSISFWSMVAVVLSGVIGRFIYIQIPRTIQGKEIDLEELQNQLEQSFTSNVNLNDDIWSKIDSYLSGERYRNITAVNSLVFIIRDMFQIRKLLRSIKSILKTEKGLSKIEIVETINRLKERLIMSRRIQHLKLMHRLFRYWHIFHLPFAITMFVIMLIHVGVTILFGYKWIF
ncbi:MAG: hypothetical protein Q8Q47_00115 [Ignavibacteriaceae bacterium]|nr:hypothetical protein [Ignavibacteriaceae bacterium]